MSAEQETWSLLLVVPGEGESEFAVVDSALSKRAAWLVWRAWKQDDERAVLLMWPNSAKIPQSFTRAS